MRKKIHEIIFEAETPMGRYFDLSLLWLIVLSVLVVVLESVGPVQQEFNLIFLYLEWAFTIIFSIEYLLRIYCVQRPTKYIFSFFGLIDLIAIIPGYLSLFVFGSSSLLVIRGFRLLRIFRLLKLGRYVGEAEILLAAVKSSRYKITVFLITVMSMATSVGALMYLIEGRENGFSSIPRGIYWAIVTMTTVGYGDLAPQTSLGQFLASVVMIMGYGIIAVPTGIVSAELVQSYNSGLNNTQSCPSCLLEGHDNDAKFCRSCGSQL